MKPIPSLQTEALEAIQTLIGVGVSDEAIGRTMRDLLGPLNISQVPKSLIAKKIQAFDEADKSALTDNSRNELKDKQSRAQAVIQQQDVLKPTKRESVILKVRLGDGSASNITISKQAFARAAALLGSDENVKKRARELAKLVPKGVSNRSKWVQENLFGTVMA